MTQIVEYRVAEHRRTPNKTFHCSFWEIFVILSTLAILAAILFPVFAKTRGCERRPTCQSNLKQIGLGIMQYVQDNDESYPQLATFKTASTVGPDSITSWRQAINTYTIAQAIFRCPTNPISQSVSVMDGYPQSYEVTDTGPIRLNQQIYLYDVPSPARTFLVFEENGNTPQAQQIGALWDLDSGEEGWTNILYGGHYGGSNYLYVDGHVKWNIPMATIANGMNRWHIHNRAPVTLRAWYKLQAATDNFPNQ